MDLNQIKEIIELMKIHDLGEFEIEEEALKLRIKRGASEAPAVQYAPAPHAPAPANTGASAPAGKAEPAEEPGIEYVRSPMVGTFYRAPSPESPPFVDEGSTVNNDTVVCIIEAMKVMNEIQAEIKGGVVAILVDNGETVEYGQPLMKIKTA